MSARAAAVRAAVRSVVLGVDGSAHARRAVRFLARLRPPVDGRVTVVRVVEPVRLPSLALLPATAREQLSAEVQRQENATRAAAQRSADAAAKALARAGWRVETAVLSGVPLTELLTAAARKRADLLVLGRRGTGGIGRLLLGSVAERAVARSPVPVLIVK